MSGPGDVGGEVSGEEAAWRDLVAHYDLTADQDLQDPPWPERESLPAHGPRLASPPIASECPGQDTTGHDKPGRSGTASDDREPDDAARHGIAAVPSDGYYIDRTRIVRPASDPRSYTPPDEPADEPYVPAPLPPVKLDPVAKGAWAALIGGPAYLLIGVLLGWTISGIGAFAAIAAFVIGFVILVLRLGDGSKRDDDDDGAVL
jgi:hypothetical protein